MLKWVQLIVGLGIGVAALAETVSQAEPSTSRFEALAPVSVSGLDISS